MADALGDDAGEVEDEKRNRFGGSRREGGGDEFEVGELSRGGWPGSAGAEEKGKVNLHMTS